MSILWLLIILIVAGFVIFITYVNSLDDEDELDF